MRASRIVGIGTSLIAIGAATAVFVIEKAQHDIVRQWTNTWWELYGRGQVVDNTGLIVRPARPEMLSEAYCLLQEYATVLHVDRRTKKLVRDLPYKRLGGLLWDARSDLLAENTRRAMSIKQKLVRYGIDMNDFILRMESELDL